MDGDGFEFGEPACLPEQSNVFSGKWLCHPPARIARKDLNGVAARVFSNDEGIVKAAFDRRVKANPWNAFLIIYFHLQDCRIFSRLRFSGFAASRAEGSAFPGKLLKFLRGCASRTSRRSFEKEKD